MAYVITSSIRYNSKISCLCKKINVLPWQMAEHFAVEVDVKNPDGVGAGIAAHLIYFVMLGYDM